MARKRETKGNETGNEMVSTINTRNFVEENEDSRKRRKSSGRKRTAVFGRCSFLPPNWFMKGHARNLAAPLFEISQPAKSGAIKIALQGAKRQPFSSVIHACVKISFMRV
jgi:hypothetical protein